VTPSLSLLGLGCSTSRHQRIRASTAAGEKRLTGPIIFLTGYGDIPQSVRAMKAGAIEFLTKPFRGEELLNAINQAIERGAELRHETSFSELVGKSTALRQLLREVEPGGPE
jgi:FixJ family two-component response regulator